MIYASPPHFLRDAKRISKAPESSRALPGGLTRATGGSTGYFCKKAKVVFLRIHALGEAKGLDQSHVEPRAVSDHVSPHSCVQARIHHGGTSSAQGQGASRVL